MIYRETILEKLYALPEPQRTKALLEFEVHEYCMVNEHKHNCLIKDIPHPEMALDENGSWIM